MYDKMNFTEEKHSVAKDIKTGKVKGYIGVCASFAMKMYARSQSAEYFNYT